MSEAVSTNPVAVVLVLFLGCLGLVLKRANDMPEEERVLQLNNEELAKIRVKKVLSHCFCIWSDSVHAVYTDVEHTPLPRERCGA